MLALLAEQGLSASAEDVAWVNPSPRSRWTGWFSRPRAVVRARREPGPHDLFLVRARLSPEGRLLGGEIHALTRTDAADEGRPVILGERVAYALSVDGTIRGVRMLDLSGEPADATRELSGISRVQHALTNLQETGQLEGIGRRHWALASQAGNVRLSVSDGVLDVEVDGRDVRIELESGRFLQGSELVTLQEIAVGQPGELLTWAVDRVRASSWFGDARMQALKGVVFSGLDRLNRARAALVPRTHAEPVAHDLGPSAARRAPSDEAFPPAPLLPILSPPLAGEGEWLPLDDDPFVTEGDDGSSALASTFVRPDRERDYARVYITAWDPRRIELHMVAGTNEPMGITGERGPGLIPRDPKVMKRLVAAMNGGFQTFHGAFGMMSEGVVYRPPKPLAATILELRDGSTAFGTWPLDTTIPSDIAAFRQNLSPLVQDGRINPHGRHFWGGTSPDRPDEVHTVRTGICLTSEGFVAYFHGLETRPETLAFAMLAARCTYGIHLDMNKGHGGLELYRVAPEGELPPLGRALESEWEAEGEIEGLEGFRFRARKMFRGMGLRGFPRYLTRQTRDFFYLVRREKPEGSESAVVVPGARRVFAETPLPAEASVSR